jgi:3'-phosphoadenosine 5'-phosphosulfate sulfotransferase (PAPS reductase)/FAD synthetase
MDLLKQRTILPLDEKEKVSKRLIRDALSCIKRPAIGFSGGKKSVMLLYLVKQECNLPLKVLFVRINGEFENMVWFVEKLKRLWHFDLIVESSTGNGPAVDPQFCCRPAIAAGLNRSVQANAIDCLLLGNTFEDPRRIKLPEGMEMSCVNPILHFSDKDIRDYIHKHKIPRCSLYDDGYEKIDCRRCTSPPATRLSDPDADENEAVIKERLKRLGYL